MITRASPASFAQRLDHYRRRVDQKLADVLDADHDVPERLLAAMRYSVLGGGKRVRPLLVYASGELIQVAEDALDAVAAAVELIHAYSLVHDDLPAMDDDDLRRGRPTTHKQFDEATAILAGDALQALAFEVLAVDRCARGAAAGAGQDAGVARTSSGTGRHGRRPIARHGCRRPASRRARPRAHSSRQDGRADPRVDHDAERARRR